ncbi:MAG: hypothetical protein JXB34_07490 [Bacteroidales bacterium]|nr:hypothetical protein [Bacteroidales bacterium]
MKPLKSLQPLSKWLLRLAVAVIVYKSFLDYALTFEFKGLLYFLALLIVLLTVLLFIGAFLKGHTLTMVSGLLLFALIVVKLFFVSGFSFNALLAVFPLAALSFYFFASGNS